MFAAVGRASHDEKVGPVAVGHTAWPFLLGAAAALVWAAYSREDPRTVSVGIRVWLVSVVAGMVLRKVAGDGAAPAFVVVATVVLGALFVGWRLVAKVQRFRSALRR